MKKLLSLFCVLAVTVGILAVGVVSASAEAPATAVDVKSGDKVTYKLSLSDVPERIVGCDFSVYFDKDVFKVDSVADFNDSTNDEDWQATINPDLPGEVRGNWSILKGVDFSKKRNIVTVNLTATKDGTAHISYFVRYMYDNSVFDSDDRPQIDQYLFTCDVTKNSKEVVSDAAPELNVAVKQPDGLFANSRTGKSADMNYALTGDSIAKNGGVVNEDANNAGNKGNNSNSGNSGNNNGSNGSGNGNSSQGDKKSGDAKDATKATDASGKVVETPTTTQTDAQGNVVVSDDKNTNTTAAKSNGGSNTMLWVIIAAVVVIAGGLIGYVVVKGKKGAAPQTEDAPQNEDKEQ